MSDETNKQTPPPQTHVAGLEKAVHTHLKWFERFICDENELNSSTPRKVAQNAQDAAAELRAALSLLHQTNVAEQHPDDLAVDRFAAAMKSKLAKKRADGRGGWDDPEQCSIAFLSKLLREHVAKGDPVDVGNLAMMIHQRRGVIE